MSSQNILYNKEEINSALEVIVKVMKLDAAQPFNTPVDPVALGIPDYSEVIDNPMDFGAIRRDLKNGVKYKNSIDVLNDVQNVWDNCSKYYTKGHYLLELMKRLKKKFTKYWIKAGLSMEQPQKMDERASSQPMKETLRESTNWLYGSVDPSQRQNQIISSQPQPHQYPHNYYMFYPPMQRPQYNMSSYNYPTPIPHGDKNSGFSVKDYSHSPFGPGSQGGQFLWRNNPIGSQLRQQHRPSFGNARPYNPHLGWQPRPESAERPYPYEQGDTNLPMFDHPIHIHKNRLSVHLPYLPVPSSPKAPSQPQHKSFQTQPLLISDDETDLSISEEDIPLQSPGVMRSRDNGPSSSSFQPTQPLEGATRVQLSSSHPQPSHLQEPSQRASSQPLTSCGQPHQPQLPPGFGKEDGWGGLIPEPRRCQRNDGKKWRCSRDASRKQKYCEGHIGRGRLRSRKDHSALTATSANMASVAEARNNNHSEDQLWSSHVVHPEPSSYHGVPPHYPDDISVLGSKACNYSWACVSAWTITLCFICVVTHIDVCYPKFDYIDGCSAFQVIVSSDCVKPKKKIYYDHTNTIGSNSIRTSQLSWGRSFCCTPLFIF